MDLVHGHHLGSRRASQEPRLMKYASKGFGVRVLPSYCKNIKIDFHERGVLEKRIYPRYSHYHYEDKDSKKGKDVLEGLKAVKAIACIADDFAHRFYLGRTELTRFDDEDDEEYFESHEDKDPEWDGLSIKNDEKTGRAIPHAKFSDMDTYRLGTRAYGHRGIPGFELLLRHEAVWRFEQQDLVTIDYDSLASVAYDGDTYDDLPKYKWNKNFSPEDYGKQVDAHNGTLFSEFLDLLAIGIYGQPQDYWSRTRIEPRQLKDYLTRRIRRMTHSQDIGELLDRFQITIPISVPYDLELYIQETFTDALKEAGFPENEKHDILIPVHKPGTGGGSLPDLKESTHYNIRYWTVDSTLAFAGIHRKIDEIYEVLWTFHTVSRALREPSIILGNIVDESRNSAPEEDDELKTQFELMLGRRVTQLSRQQLAGVSKDEHSAEKFEENTSEAQKPGAISSESVNSTLFPDERERSLFESWLLEAPLPIYRHYTEGTYHRDYHEQDYVFPPEHMYWREGVDGVSNQWTKRHDDQQDGKNKDTDMADDEDAAGESSRGLKRRREDSDLTAMTGRAR